MAPSSLDAASPPRNHHRLHLDDGTSRCCLLVHQLYPYFAFAQPPDEHTLSYDFIDRPKLVGAFRKVAAWRDPGREYLWLSAEWLARSPESDPGTLSDADADQADYWEPQTLGEILFNHWD